MGAHWAIGLTGSRCTGKSSVASLFKEKGVYVCDADIIAKALYQPGEPVWDALIQAFGDHIKDSDGRLNRRQLANIIFRDVQKRNVLEAIVHPEVKQRIRQLLHDKQSSSMVVVEASLLLEAHFHDIVDKIIVVHCDETLQIERCIQRDGLARDDVYDRISCQFSQQKKIKHADFLINTDGSLLNTRRQFEEIWEKLKKTK